MGKKEEKERKGGRENSCRKNSCLDVSLFFGGREVKF